MNFHFIWVKSSQMWTEDRFAFFHRIRSVLLNILYLLPVVARIKDAGKVEGIIQSLLILSIVGSIALKTTIQIYHTKLIQAANKVILLNQKLGKTTINLSIRLEFNSSSLIFYPNINPKAAGRSESMDLRTSWQRVWFWVEHVPPCAWTSSIHRVLSMSAIGKGLLPTLCF